MNIFYINEYEFVKILRMMEDEDFFNLSHAVNCELEYRQKIKNKELVDIESVISMNFP